MGKAHLEKARKSKDDEFYTSLNDVEDGCRFYHPQLKNKIVLCNCDDYKISNFVKYFKEHFDEIGLKKLIALNVHTNEKYEFDGTKESIIKCNNCAFGNSESDAILQSADVVITNPPFSLFRDFFKNLTDNKKKFLIISPLLSISYVAIYDDFLNGNIRIGYSKKTQLKFTRPDGTTKSAPIIWLTNLDTSYPEPLKLKTNYNPLIHKKYDDFHDFINVARVSECPQDYKEWMGLPITFLTHYNPEQFELSREYLINHTLHINGKSVFLRVFARLK